MSYDGKLLRVAKERIDKRRTENEEMYTRRRETANLLNPRIREIEMELRSTMADTIAAALSGGSHADKRAALDSIKETNLKLQEERRKELVKAGLPEDYLDEKYICPICRDTGYDGTNLCECLKKFYREEQVKELSETLKLGEDTFETFDLSYYNAAPSPETGVSDRKIMSTALELCRTYAYGFSSSKIMNLYFYGTPGLGKTFLSTSIAKVVLENGFSVVYDTAISSLGKYEELKFGRSLNPAETRADIQRLETCDLLILDDLGAEMTTPVSVSGLYTLINTRLTSKKKTIISSNLSPSELGKRYSSAIMSRITGEYYLLHFVGRDIRALKKDK